MSWAGAVWKKKDPHAELVRGHPALGRPMALWPHLQVTPMAFSSPERAGPCQAISQLEECIGWPSMKSSFRLPERYSRSCLSETPFADAEQP